MRVLVIEHDKRLPATIALRWRVELQDGGWWTSPIWGNTKNDDTLQALLTDLRQKEPAFGIEDRRYQ
jgi:hypothetical protein